MKQYAKHVQEQGVPDLGIQGPEIGVRVENSEPVATPEVLPDMAAVVDLIEDTPVTTEPADPTGEFETENLTRFNPFEDGSDDKDKPAAAGNGQNIKDQTTDQSIVVAQVQAPENPFADSPPPQSMQPSEIPATEPTGTTADLEEEFQVVANPSA